MRDRSAFDSFVAEVRPRLARALLAAYGVERGSDALSEAMAYAWEHYDRISVMANPAGFLFRVGQSRSRVRRSVRLPPPSEIGLPDVEPGLVEGLLRLSERQRICVVLVYAFEWSHQEVSDLLGIGRSTVQSHVERGLQQLRTTIGVITDG